MAEPRSQRMRHQLLRFLLVGGAGFAADTLVLWFLLYGLGYLAESGGLIGSRVVSFLVAISVTYPLHAHFTFQASLRRSKLARYVVIQVIGALINIGTYTFLVLGPLQRPLIAMALGSALATISNFVLARRFVYYWRDTRDES